MLLNKEKYNYPILTRQNTKLGRQYLVLEKYIPSVTTILSATKSAESIRKLENWKERVGYKNAQQISTEAANVGTLMHKNLENHIKGILVEEKSNLIFQQAKKMSDTIIENAFPHISEVYGNEVSLYYDGLYSGTTDAVGLWDNELAIIDFKQSNKTKKEEWIDDYYLQLTAYALAHNEMFETNIRKGVVLICTRNCDYQEFILEGDQFDQKALEWTQRVEEYYSKVLTES